MLGIGVLLLLFYVESHDILLLLSLLLLKMSLQCKAGREWEHTTVRRPNATQPARKRGNRRRRKVAADLANKKALGSDLKTRQSHTMKHRVIKIVSQRHWEEHNGPEEPRSSTSMSGKRVPLSKQSTTSHMHRHIRQGPCTAKRMHWVTIDLK